MKDELVEVGVREEAGEHVVTNEGRSDVRQSARICRGVAEDVAGDEIVKNCVTKKLQFLVAVSQPVVLVAGVGEGFQ